MDSDITLVNFPPCYIKTHWPIFNFECIFCSCTDHLEGISSPNYVGLPYVHIFNMQYQKITFVNITTHLIRKLFRYWEVYELTGSETKFYFVHENSNFITVGCLPCNDSLTSLFEKMSSKCSSLNNHSSSKNMLYYEKCK